VCVWPRPWNSDVRQARVAARFRVNALRRAAANRLHVRKRRTNAERRVCPEYAFRCCALQRGARKAMASNMRHQLGNHAKQRRHSASGCRACRLWREDAVVRTGSPAPPCPCASDLKPYHAAPGGNVSTAIEAVVVGGGVGTSKPIPLVRNKQLVGNVMVPPGSAATRPRGIEFAWWYADPRKCCRLRTG